VPSLHALAYLGWRAIVVQPIKRLFRRGTALERFAAAYQGEGLLPTSLADRDLSLAASRCTGCSLCEAGCRLSAAEPAVRALGLPAAFRLAARQQRELPAARALLDACGGCAGCEPLCPAGVPIGRLLARLGERARAAAVPGAAPATAGVSSVA
jgi:Fe-S oxidoreductase